MSKELEALESIFNKPFTCDEEYTLLKQALTPPTAEQVCETLSEYMNVEVYYKEGYYGDSFLYKDNDKTKWIVSLYKHKVAWVFELKIPPHLITMIGRFYEGEIK